MQKDFLKQNPSESWEVFSLYSSSEQRFGKSEYLSGLWSGAPNCRGKTWWRH